MTYRVLTEESNTDEWLRLRKQGIGASEAAAILGDTNWGSPLTVWQEKTSDEIVDIGTDRMMWGHRLESVILGAVTWDHPELGQVIPSEGLLQSVEYPWLLGTLDAQIDSPVWGIVPVEVKNVSAFEKKNWFDRSGMIAVPPKYAIQVRQQAFIKDDAPGGYVAVLFDGNELEVIWVPRSQEFIDNHLIGTLGDFWNINVLQGITPDPIMGDDLATLWPVDEGSKVEADETFLEMRERWIDAKGREKQVKEDIETLRFYFGVFMEENEIAVVDGKPVFKMPSRSGARRVAVASHEAHHPDCAECITRDRDSRTPQAIIPKAVKP
jgi:putative phage-type endonuclease